jgi:hypothetical protein
LLTALHMRKLNELALLEEALSITKRSGRTSFYSASWLQSPFEAPVWKVVTERESYLNFNVLLDDGLPLTHAKHAKLLEIMKCFFIIQAHPEHTKGVVYSKVTTASRLDVASHICDYLILRSAQFRMSEFGLQAISNSDAIALVKALATLEVSEGVYEWPKRLTEYLKRQGATLNGAQIERAIERNPHLAEVSAVERSLSFSDEELVRARVWLLLNDHYKVVANQNGYSQIPNGGSLQAAIYPEGTLKTTWMKSHSPDLLLLCGPRTLREMPGVSVRGQLRSEYTHRQYVRALEGFRLFDRIGLPVPTSLIEVTRNRVFLQGLDLQPPGRYKSIPHEIVLIGFRNAIEFALEYGAELLESYLRIASSMGTTDRTVRSFLQEHDIAIFLGPKLIQAGVSCWSVSQEIRLAHGSDLSLASLKESEVLFFERFRKNNGLYEMLEVFGGSLLVILGTLMSRRQGELIDLVCGSMLDESETRLRFFGRKTGTGDIRRLLERPLPSIAVELLHLVESFQEKLVSMGVISKLTNLFAFPLLVRVGLAKVGDAHCNLMLDRFCDYFQVASTSSSERYYFRQHQLRRFFAMLFFWGNSFSGLDTLRWFLGHSDAAHLYHYITESVPGDVLRSVKADFALERVLAEDPQTRPLLDLIEAHFQTREILLLDADELAEYIYSLLESNAVTVEPHFFRKPDGSEFTIMIDVIRKDGKYGQ